jgi:hypothetical protein
MFKNVVQNIDMICEEPLVYGIGTGKYNVRSSELYLRQSKYLWFWYSRHVGEIRFV